MPLALQRSLHLAAVANCYSHSPTCIATHFQCRNSIDYAKNRCMFVSKKLVQTYFLNDNDFVCIVNCFG